MTRHRLTKRIAFGGVAMLMIAGILVAARAEPTKEPTMKGKPLERMKPYKMKDFLIGTWPFGSGNTDEFCKRYQAAGFNTMVDAPTMLDVAHKHGLKVIITTLLHPVYKDGVWMKDKWTMGPYARVKDIQWFDAHYGKHPALIGYLLNDNCQLHDYTIETSRWLRKNRPKLIPYMSHNPDPAGQAKVIDALPILSSQNYPFGGDNSGPDAPKRKAFCTRLEADRAHANKHDMVLWPIFAVVARPNHIGRSQIRFQAFSSIAYGAQALFYFAYSSRRPVWKEGGTTRVAVTYCNDYIVPHVGPRVLGTRSIGAYHHPADKDVPKGALEMAEDRLVEALSENCLAGVLVAEKDFKANRQLPAYVMLVDKRTCPEAKKDPPAREVYITFGPAVRKVHILGNKHRTGSVKGNTATVTLKGGDGVLLRVE